VISCVAHIIDGKRVKIPSKIDLICPGYLDTFFDKVVDDIEDNRVTHCLSHGKSCDSTYRIHTGIHNSLTPHHGDDLIGMTCLKTALGQGFGDGNGSIF